MKNDSKEFKERIFIIPAKKTYLLLTKSINFFRLFKIVI